MARRPTPTRTDPRLLVGDCLERLPELPATYADSMVTDPPSGQNFGDHDWDRFGPERSGSAAAEFLIPPEHQERLHRLSTDSEVKAFADDIGIAPGIVIGRLQHDEKWGWNKGHGLKRSLRIVDAED